MVLVLDVTSWGFGARRLGAVDHSRIVAETPGHDDLRGQQQQHEEHEPAGDDLAHAAHRGIAAALAQPVALPKSTLVPVTANSHPLGAASQTLQPVDLAKAGYVEEEFILSGKANVYEWLASGTVARTVSGPYTNRILVRHPSDPARFSGKYEPITSTMSFAAAICSIVSEGMVPMRA